MAPRFVTHFVILAFLANMVNGPCLAQSGQDEPMPFLPAAGEMVQLSPDYTPAHLQGLTIHPDNALQFDFLIYKGDENLEADKKRAAYKKLIKYFLASLTIPDEDQWVNLSPYENNRIIKEDFGKTEMGRDLLAEDYILKQVSSSLIYPDGAWGRKFWDKVYERAWKEYHTNQVPVNTFNKVWIVPDTAFIYESGNTAYILQSHLKVMLEEDYLSLSHHAISAQPGVQNDTHAIGSQVIREIVVPELEKEVNNGKNFAALRQMYSGMVLATWYKKALRESLLGKVFADKAKVKGIDQDPKTNESIYEQYLKAFKKGVFNYIKDDIDHYTDEEIPRKYFSGGFSRHDPTRKVQTALIVFHPGGRLPHNLAMTAPAEEGFLDKAAVILNPENGTRSQTMNPNSTAMKDRDSAMAAFQPDWRDEMSKARQYIQGQDWAAAKGILDNARSGIRPGGSMNRLQRWYYKLNRVEELYRRAPDYLGKRPKLNIDQAMAGDQTVPEHHAVLTRNGGVDFNAAHLNMLIRYNGRGVPLPLANQDMAQLNRIQGFDLEIIEIQPALHEPVLSELRRNLQTSST